MAHSTQVDDINTLSSFLTNNQIPDLETFTEIRQIDVIVSCVSSVLLPTAKLFETLIDNPSLTKTLVLCGGIGHSTSYIYEAVAAHPVYHQIQNQIIGLPESRVLLKILETFYDISRLIQAGMRILVEERSTNCGANAVECKKVLDEAGISPKTIVLYQDSTMSLRTKAGFDKVYQEMEVDVLCWTGWLPRVMEDTSGRIVFDIKRAEKELRREVIKQDLWSIQRFLDLLMGEIPRFERYGPKGLGSIVDVEIPGAVAEAWERLRLLALGER